jgi:hypothetical protein
MADDADPISVEAAPKAFGAATFQHAQATACSHGPVGRRLRREFLQNGSQSRGYRGGFTLAELVVSVGVLVLLVFLATQLINSATTVTTLGHKQMDADSQARQILDRMAIDFAQMVKRSDVDYYVKSSATPPPTGVRHLLFPGNDRIAFYSTVPGYYPSTGSRSPLSLVSYRVNAQNKLERMGQGLVWNGVSTSLTPVVFMPIPVASPIPAVEFATPTPTATPPPAWPNVDNLNAIPTPDPSTEVIGPQVFRFEYYYLLKGQVVSGTTYNSIFTDTPWDTRINSCCATTGSPVCCHTAPSGMQDVAAIVVDIAVIDPKSKVLLNDPNSQLTSLAGQLGDYSSGMVPGQLLANWRAALDANIYPNGLGLPAQVISGIRVYERYFYLNQ